MASSKRLSLDPGPKTMVPMMRGHSRGTRPLEVGESQIPSSVATAYSLTKKRWADGVHVPPGRLTRRFRAAA